MSIVSRERYNQDKIARLHDYLKKYADLHEPIDYEILVDGFKAVRRTSNADMFPLYEDFVTGDTRSIEVLFYQGTSNNNDKHIFILKEGNEKSEESLSGIEVESKIQDGIEKARKEWEQDRVREENERLKKEVKELEEEVEELEEELEQIKNNQSPLSGLIGEVGSSFVESMIRRNPKLLASIPGGRALSGMLDNDQHPVGQREEDAEISFQAKTGNSRDEEAEKALAFVGYLRERFQGHRYELLMDVLDRLSEQEGLLEQVSELIRK